ncbi:MAG: hypothetical protein AB1705_23210 [Verrucomicrobiota bacterium]
MAPWRGLTNILKRRRPARSNMRLEKSWLLIAAAVALVAVLLWRSPDEHPRAASSNSPRPSVATSAKPVPTPSPAQRRLNAAGTSPGTSADSFRATLKRLVDGDTNVFQLSSEMVARYLERNGRSADSLLNAFHASHDPAHLKAALEQFPDDPEVLFHVVAHDIFPEERRRWLDELKRAAPDNALANALSAREHLRHGQTALALQELQQAAAKGNFQDYTSAKVQGMEEIYMHAGKSPVEAKMLAMSNALLPHLHHLRDTSRELATLHQQAVTAGNTDAANEMAAAGRALGQHLSNGQGGTILMQLVGIAMEMDFLRQLTPDAPYSFLPGTPTERIAEIEARKKAIRDNIHVFNEWLPAATESEIINYFDRMKLFGESAAMAWLQNRRAP